MGECSKCGECCKWLQFEIPGLGNDRNKQEYFKAHGCKREGDKLLVPMRCPHLTEENLCDIHDHKPFLCSSWKGSTKGFWKPKCCTL